MPTSRFSSTCTLAWPKPVRSTMRLASSMFCSRSSFLRSAMLFAPTSGKPASVGTREVERIVGHVLSSGSGTSGSSSNSGCDTPPCSSVRPSSVNAARSCRWRWMESTLNNESCSGNRSSSCLASRPVAPGELVVAVGRGRSTCAGGPRRSGRQALAQPIVGQVDVRLLVRQPRVQRTKRPTALAEEQLGDHGAGEHAHPQAWDVDTCSPSAPRPATDGCWWRTLRSCGWHRDRRSPPRRPRPGSDCG